jgi:hypothetical protein
MMTARVQETGTVARGTIVMLCLAVAGVCASAPPAAGQERVRSHSAPRPEQEATVPAVEVIEEIALERGCFGCPTGTLVVLRRDGLARLTVVGQARHGTVDRVAQGAIPPADFNRLAARVCEAGFFALDDEYLDPRLQDGAWTTVTVRRGERETRVYAQEDAAPAALRAIVAAVDATVKALGLPEPVEPARR